MNGRKTHIGQIPNKAVQLDLASRRLGLAKELGVVINKGPILSSGETGS